MKRIGDLALVVIAVVLIVGLFTFKDYNRYQLETVVSESSYFPDVAEGVVYLIDTRTGNVWWTVGGHDFMKIQFPAELSNLGDSL